MKPSTINQLKKELELLPQDEVVAFAIRLAKYKKENKELLSYLLFDANMEMEFVERIKKEIELQFSEINQSNLYYAKKSIRKILRITRKYIKFSGNIITEVELLSHFLFTLKNSGINWEESLTMSNLYKNQCNNLHKAYKKLHEDLRYDYRDKVKEFISID